jgi:hypothetical protein
MSNIFCNDCGAELDEAPTLLPQQRPPCPNCGSLARRFEQTVGSNFFRLPGEQPVTVVRTSPDVRAHAQTAMGTGEALPPTVHVEEPRGGRATGEQRTDASGPAVRAPRRITDHLVVMGRSVWWTHLTEDGGWMVQVVDEAGEVLAIATNYDPIEALAAVAEFVLPGHPG